MLAKLMEGDVLARLDEWQPESLPDRVRKVDRTVAEGVERYLATIEARRGTTLAAVCAIVHVPVLMMLLMEFLGWGDARRTISAKVDGRLDRIESRAIEWLGNAAGDQHHA